MLAYNNFVGGKLRLKGKPLDVKTGGVTKKKKKKTRYQVFSGIAAQTGCGGGQFADHSDEIEEEGNYEHSNDDCYLTPAEKRFLEQTERLELRRLEKMASKSHRDRIHEFNKCLANLTEHYDIPKVGPG